MINRLLFPLLILLIGCSEGYNDTDINLEQKIPEVHININTPLEYVSKNEYSNGTIQIENSEDYCLCSLRLWD